METIVKSKASWTIAVLLLLPVLIIAIISKVEYTEIDWTTYMQQVQLVLKGERNYTNIKGDTGLLVYPAGHVLVFSLLHRLTSAGTDIRVAQYLFGALEWITVAIVLLIYSKSKIPGYWSISLILSKRIHSIYSLRLFNDPVAMLLMYICIYFIIANRWELGSIFFRYVLLICSLALSVKMNILLFAPGMAIVFYQSIGIARSFFNALLVIAVQVINPY